MTTILNLTGESGKEYELIVYPYNIYFKGSVACVYYVSKRAPDYDGEFSHTPIYIGQTDDFNECYSNHPKQECFDLKGYNSISIILVEDEDERQRIEADLLGKFTPQGNV